MVRIPLWTTFLYELMNSAQPFSERVTNVSSKAFWLRSSSFSSMRKIVKFWFFLHGWCRQRPFSKNIGSLQFMTDLGINTTRPHQDSKLSAAQSRQKSRVQKSDNLQYNMVGRWSNVYFDRLGIIQWNSGSVNLTEGISNCSLLWK